MTGSTRFWISALLLLASAGAESSWAQCRFSGKTYADGRKLTVYASSSVDFGKSCTGISLTCRTTGSGSKKSSSWYRGSKKLSSVSGYFASCQVRPPLPCTAGGKKIEHGAAVTLYRESQVPVTQDCQSQSRSCVNGVLGGDAAFQYASCSNCPTGKVATSYSFTDADGDGYYKADGGRICVPQGVLLHPTTKTLWLPYTEGGVSYAASVSLTRRETEAADKDPLDPIGSFTLVGPSEKGSGFWNGYEVILYEYFAPGAGFHHQNTIRAERLWNPDFMNRGYRVVSEVGGSRQFSYWVSPVAGDSTEAFGQSAQVDAGGRVMIACGVAPGTEFELLVRDIRTRFEQRYRFFSAGDGPACLPDPEPTPTPELCLDPNATNNWQEGECIYPTPTPTETRDPGPDPEPTETGCAENCESKCPSEEDPSVKFHAVQDGIVTKYGYDGDSTPDANSSAGRASCTTWADLNQNDTPDRVDFLNEVLVPRGDQTAIDDWKASRTNKNFSFPTHFLRPGEDIALSHDLLPLFGTGNDYSFCGAIIEAKVETGTDGNGKPIYECFTGRVWDQTAKYHEGRALKGRVDVYSPQGDPPFHGKPVVGVRKVQ